MLNKSKLRFGVFIIYFTISLLLPGTWKWIWVSNIPCIRQTNTTYLQTTISIFVQHGFRYVTILLLANFRVLTLFSLFTDDESISVLLHVSSHYERQNQSSKWRGIAHATVRHNVCHTVATVAALMLLVKPISVLVFISLLMNSVMQRNTASTCLVFQLFSQIQHLHKIKYTKIIGHFFIVYTS